MKTIFRLSLFSILVAGAYQVLINKSAILDFYHHSKGQLFSDKNENSIQQVKPLDHQDSVYAETAIWYRQYLKTHKLCTDPGTIAFVKSVTDELIPAAKQYMEQRGLSDRFNKFNWEVNVVQSNEVNAWCVAGGKIIVYTGILKYTGKDQDKLATVLGHEISHALEDHVIKDDKREATYSKAGSLIASLLSKKIKNKTVIKYGTSALTKLAVRLPFSRAQERQADHIGVELMALAGFDINKAVDFWDDMGAGSGKGSKLATILSTHPSDIHRADLIQKEVDQINVKGISYVISNDDSNFPLLALK